MQGAGEAPESRFRTAQDFRRGHGAAMRCPCGEGRKRAPKLTPREAPRYYRSRCEATSAGRVGDPQGSGRSEALAKTLAAQRRQSNAGPD